ncbi:hypothetical protein [Pseudofrankia inefficax]|nr:hypothetical protein [Pseudofrankia inefficax]
MSTDGDPAGPPADGAPAHEPRPAPAAPADRAGIEAGDAAPRDVGPVAPERPGGGLGAVSRRWKATSPPGAGSRRDAGPRRQFTERERAINALAYPVAGTAAAAVVVVIVVALVDPSPGRHVRGLLILLALVGLLAAACGWVRTVWHGPTDDPGADAATDGPSSPAHSAARPQGGERQIVRHVE